jgi:hypothetical protein
MTLDRAAAAAIRPGLPSSHKKTGRLGLPIQNQVAMAKDLGELHVRGLLAAPALVVFDLEGDLVALV